MAAHTVGAKITKNQRTELDAYIERFYPEIERAEYIRFAIEQEMKSNDVAWTHEDLIGNRERSARGKRGEQGIPWKPHEKRQRTPES